MKPAKYLTKEELAQALAANANQYGRMMRVPERELRKFYARKMAAK